MQAIKLKKQFETKIFAKIKHKKNLHKTKFQQPPWPLRTLSHCHQFPLAFKPFFFAQNMSHDVAAVFAVI